MKIVEKLESQDGDAKVYKHVSDCSLFVCNKWDQVPKNERDQVKSYVMERLSKYWDESQLLGQIVFMSISESIKAQEYGADTPEFNDILQILQQMIVAAINGRLYSHWK